MPAKPFYLNDKLESLVRKCIVFPADGSETRIVHMIARTVTVEDTASLTLYSRCVDMASTFGDNYRKTRVMDCKSAQDGVQSTYLFFYNLSPNLPINLNVAHVIGVAPSHLKTRKRLFWRGDIVAMKVQPESERVDFVVESLDADLFELRPLEEVLRKRYQEGFLERLLHYEEQEWDSYLSHDCGPTSLLLGASTSYWGANAAEKEENFLHDLNELRCAAGRLPLPPPVYMKSYTEHALTLYAAFKSSFRLRQKVTGPPKLPPELERRIFEMCALESPEVCTVLMLLARRVYEWIDPISIATVCIMEDIESKRRNGLEHFLAKLTNGKPVEYYAQHIKNLSISAGSSQNKEIDRILAICTGVENLVLSGSACGFAFFENPQAGRNLRRLTITLENFYRPFGSTPDFYHPCFANLTHLHLSDWNCDWSTYTGWETLASLTHLAIAYLASPEKIMQLMQTLPTVRYVALGHYGGREWLEYPDATVDNDPHIRATWGVRVVRLLELPPYDWERGARGDGDFWDLVEQEVERRLQEGSVD